MLLNHLASAVIGLASLGLAAPADINQPCGFKIANCPEGSTCIPNSKDCVDLTRCLGTCSKTVYPSCGGFTPTPNLCDENSVCIDDPRRLGGCGMACDMPGICVPKKASRCGGIAGYACPTGLTCYDLPNDGCDPRNGGADCIGICL